MAHGLSFTVGAGKPWHGFECKPMTVDAALDYYGARFEVRFVPVSIVCQNTLGGAWKRPTLLERVSSWLSSVVDAFESSD